MTRLSFIFLGLYLLVASSFSLAAPLEESLDSLQIRVQTVIAEGLGWDLSQASGEPAIHVIITAFNTTSEKPVDNTPLFFSVGAEDKKRKAAPLPILIERGSDHDDFEKLQIYPHSQSREPLQVKTNPMGRVSFSIPLSSIESTFPVLLIRSESMPRDSWVAAHLDEDARHKIGSMTPPQLQSLLKSAQAFPESKNTSNPTLPLDSIKSLHHLLRTLMNSTAGSEPFFFTNSSNASLVKRSTTHAPHFHDSSRSSQLFFDPIRHHVTTYEVNGLDNAQSHVFERTIRGFDADSIVLLNKRDGIQPAINTSYLIHLREALRKFKNSSVLVHDKESQWALAAVDHDKKLYAVSTKHSAKEPRGFFLNSVSRVWKLVRRIFAGVKHTLSSILSALRSAFRFDDILRTHRFLNKYFRLIAPLGFNGFELMRDKAEQWADNSSVSSFYAFNETIAKNGGIDLTLKNMHETVDSLPKKWATIREARHGHPFAGVSFDSFNATNGNPSNAQTHHDMTPLNSDGLTHMVHDRVINQMPNLALQERNNNNSAVVRLFSLVKEMASALGHIFDLEKFDLTHRHIIQFHKDTPLWNRTVVNILNMMNSIMANSKHTVIHVMEALQTLLPMYWNAATEFMLMPLKMTGFLYTWWTKKLTKNKSEFSFNEILTLAGATYGTWVFKLYFDGVAPFSEADIEVLESVQDPELLVHTWNTDPRTYVPESDEIRRLLRLGLYDWIPKCNWALLNTFMSLSVTLPNLLTVRSVLNPPDSTKPGQLFSAIAGIQGRISQYPMTQLTTTDPAALKKSKMNPSGRYLAWWYFGVIEDVTRTVRPFMSAKFNRFPRYHIAHLITSTLPSLYFGWISNLKTAQGIPKDDYPRQFVMSLNWIAQATSTFNAFTPFIPDVILPEAARFWIQIGKDALGFAIQHLRSHAMVAFRVIGMMSSSFQGGPPKIRLY